MSTNPDTELIERLHRASFGHPISVEKGTRDLLWEAKGALEAAEAELTRRDTVIARIAEWRASAEGRKLLGDPAAMDWPIDLYLAAAPVSLEAVKAETTTEWACIANGIVRPLGSRPAALEHAQLCGGSIQEREVTEWRPVSTEGETK